MVKIKPKKKILIIEDDKFLAQMLAQTLEDAGFESVYAITGKEGLSKARLTLPSMIILDIILPDLDGFEALVDLKKDKETKKIPILILSNLGQDEDVHQGIKLGAVDYIVKTDYSLDDVVRKVKKYLL